LYNCRSEYYHVSLSKITGVAQTYLKTDVALTALFDKTKTSFPVHTHHPRPRSARLIIANRPCKVILGNVRPDFQIKLNGQ